MKRQLSPPIPYLASISEKEQPSARVAAIREALRQQNYWDETTEWRIFTPMVSRIEHRIEDNRWVFRATVTCDHTFSAACPTLERAIEFLGVYERLIQDLWRSLGWPSWASRMDP